MPVNPAVRVGILVVIALLAFTLVAVFLTGWRLNVAGYPIVVVFDDALGLTKGSEVRMAGVVIGNVKEITLNSRQRAVLTLQINRKYRIPVGSEFILRTGLLIGDKYVEIVPNRGANRYYQPCTIERCPVIQGKVPPRVEDLIPKVDRVLTSLERTSNNINNVLGSEEFQRRLNNTLVNVESATARLDRTMAAIEGTVVGEQGSVRAIIANVNAASQSLRAFTAELEGVSTGELQQGLGGTVQAARRAAESLERSVTSLEQLVTDPELQEDIRETVRGARAAVEEAQETIGRFGSIFGGGVGIKGPKVNFREPTLDVLFRPADDGARVDAYTTIPMGGRRFLRLGLYDFADGNKAIIQPGIALSDKADLRYGMYASRLGVGYDYAFSDRVFGTVNLYDQKDLKLDLQSGYKLTDDVGVLLGVDSLFNDNKLTLGVRLTR